MKDSLNWGFSTLGCPELSLPEAVALADEFDIRFLSIRVLSGTIDLPEQFKRRDNCDALTELVAADRIRVIGASFCLMSSDEKARETILALGELADRFGVPYLRVFGGFPYQEELTGERLKTAEENLRWWKSTGLKAQLALEVHDGFSSAVRCDRLFQFLGNSLPVVWDMHNSFLVGEDFETGWKLLHENLVDVHVRDGVGPRCVLPGTGEVPVPDFLNILRRNAYNGPVTFEYEKMWQKDLPDFRLALEALSLWRKNLRHE